MIKNIEDFLYELMKYEKTHIRIEKDEGKTFSVVSAPDVDVSIWMCNTHDTNVELAMKYNHGSRNKIFNIEIERISNFLADFSELMEKQQNQEFFNRYGTKAIQYQKMIHAILANESHSLLKNIEQAEISKQYDGITETRNFTMHENDYTHHLSIKRNVYPYSYMECVKIEVGMVVQNEQGGFISQHYSPFIMAGFAHYYPMIQEKLELSWIPGTNEVDEIVKTLSSVKTSENLKFANMLRLKNNLLKDDALDANKSEKEKSLKI
jgi:hypothetical protein